MSVCRFVGLQNDHSTKQAKQVCRFANYPFRGIAANHKPGGRHNKRIAERAFMFPTKLSMTHKGTPQATQDEPGGKPSNDNGERLQCDTSERDAVGGGQGVWGAKKVLPELVARYQINRSYQKTNDPIRHMRGTK